MLLVSPKEDRRRFMMKAHDLGMTKGDYVFYTIDMIPDEEVLNPEAVWRGNDGRDKEAREAFEAVFHVSKSTHPCLLSCLNFSGPPFLSFNEDSLSAL